MSTIKTETIFTGTQVFEKLPNGQWKDIHANIADLQTKVRDAAGGFTDCTRLPDEKTDGKTLAVYTGGNKTDAMTVCNQGVGGRRCSPALRNRCRRPDCAGWQSPASASVIALRLRRYQSTGGFELEHNPEKLQTFRIRLCGETRA